MKAKLREYILNYKKNDKINAAKRLLKKTQDAKTKYDKTESFEKLTPSKQDPAAALAWAKQNPQDPKAIQIINKLQERKNKGM